MTVPLTVPRPRRVPDGPGAVAVMSTVSPSDEVAAGGAVGQVQRVRAVAGQLEQRAEPVGASPETVPEA